MQHHDRIHPKLKGYDYSSGGMYFLTICSRRKEHLFARIVVRDALDLPSEELTEYGECIENVINYIAQNNPAAVIDQYVIMPNHIHLLVIVTDPKGGASVKPRPTDAVIPKVVSSLKRFTNKIC